MSLVHLNTPQHLFGCAIAQLISNLLPPSGLHFLRRELHQELLQFFLFEKKEKMFPEL